MALQLDGSDEYISRVISLPNKATFCCWLYTCSLSNRQRYFGGDTDFECRIETNGKVLNELYTIGGNGAINSDTSLSINKWYHITCTADKTTGVGEIYIWDGTTETYKSGTGLTGTPSDTTVCVGGSHWKVPNNCLNGYIEDARLYSSVLSAEAIETIRNSEGHDFILDDIIFWYPLVDKPIGASTDPVREMTNNADATPNNISFADGIISMR